MDEAFGNWLAGFIDGEGHFGIYQRSPTEVYCRFVLRVRLDDAEVIREIIRQTDIGTTYLSKRPKGSRGAPTIAWYVFKTADSLRLAEFLDRFPLRAKKRRDFEIWRIAVYQQIENTGHGWGNSATAQHKKYVKRMLRLKDALQEIKRYEAEDPADLPESEANVQQLRLVGSQGGDA